MEEYETPEEFMEDILHADPHSGAAMVGPMLISYILLGEEVYLMHRAGAVSGPVSGAAQFVRDLPEWKAHEFRDAWAAMEADRED